MSDETRGVPLVEHHTLSFAGRPRYFTAAEDETPTHTAYTVAEARLLEDIVSVFRAVGPQRATGAQALLDQLDALRKDHDV